MLSDHLIYSWTDLFSFEQKRATNYSSELIAQWSSLHFSPIFPFFRFGPLGCNSYTALAYLQCEIIAICVHQCHFLFTQLTSVRYRTQSFDRWSWSGRTLRPMVESNVWPIDHNAFQTNPFQNTMHSTTTKKLGKEGWYSRNRKFFLISDYLSDFSRKKFQKFIFLTAKSDSWEFRTSFSGTRYPDCFLKQGSRW